MYCPWRFNAERESINIRNESKLDIDVTEVKESFGTITGWALQSKWKRVGKEEAKRKFVEKFFAQLLRTDLFKRIRFGFLASLSTTTLVDAG